MSEQSSILVEDLVKVYEPTPRWMRALARSNLRSPIRALDGISFQVSPGEICVVLGPNGAGKTTAFRVLVGLTTATSGTATVMGYSAGTEPVAVRRLVGWMPGDHRSLLMRHSVEENLRFHGSLQGLSHKKLTTSIRHTLRRVGLEGRDKSTCFSLSSGMRARLQLARAILHEPRVLILDEPTGTVDPVASNEIVDLILDIVAEREIAVIISSHRLEEVERLHSRVLLLDNGRLRYDGSLDRLRDTYATPRLEIGFGSVDVARDAELALERAGIARVELNSTGVSCVLGPEVGLRQVLETLGHRSEKIVSIQDKQPPLHAILASIYSNGGSLTNNPKSDE